MKKVAIVGGGISAVSAAYFIRRAAERAGVDISLELFEAGPRLGGKIHTEHGGSGVLERGAEALALKDETLAPLLEGLGLSLKRPAPLPFGVRQGGGITRVDPRLLRSFPGNLRAIWQSRDLSVRGKLAATLVPLVRQNRGAVPDIPLDQYLKESFGEEAAEKLLAPIYGGIYGGHASEMSARIIRQRSTAGGGRSLAFVTVSTGMQSMVGAFVDHSGAQIHLSTPVSKIRRSQCQWAIDSTGVFDAVIVAVPAPLAGALLSESAPAVAQRLSEVRFTRAASVLLSLPPTTLPRMTGYLIPGSAEVRGVSFVSQKWAHVEGGETAVRVFVHPRDGFDEDRVTRIAVSELEALTSQKIEPRRVLVDYWDHGLPVLAPGFESRAKRIRDELPSFPGLFLPAGIYEGSGIFDCIRGAEKAAGEAVSFLTARTRAFIREENHDDRISAGHR